MQSPDVSAYDAAHRSLDRLNVGSRIFEAGAAITAIFVGVLALVQGHWSVAAWTGIALAWIVVARMERLRAELYRSLWKGK